MNPAVSADPSSALPVDRPRGLRASAVSSAARAGWFVVETMLYATASA